MSVLLRFGMNRSPPPGVFLPGVVPPSLPGERPGDRRLLLLGVFRRLSLSRFSPAPPPVT